MRVLTYQHNGAATGAARLIGQKGPRIMSNDAIVQLVANATEKWTEANEIAARVAKSNGSVAKDVKTARETSEDETVAKFRDWLEKALAKINSETEKINGYILSNGIVHGNVMTDEEVASAKEEHKALAKAAAESWKAAETVATILGQTMPEKPEVLTFSGKASSGNGGGGTGGRRLRFSRVEVNGTEVKNLSAVSQKIKSDTGKSVTAKDLQQALFETIGTDDISGLSDAEFAVSETDKDGNVHSYTVAVFRDKSDDATESDESDDDESDEATDSE